MNCIHGLGSSVVDYVISNILVYNQIVNFYLLNDHESGSNHIPLTLTINFIMQKNPLKITLVTKGIFFLTKKIYDLFLKDLNTELNRLSYKNNIDDIYCNFTTTLSTSIK